MATTLQSPRSSSGRSGRSSRSSSRKSKDVCGEFKSLSFDEREEDSRRNNRESKCSGVFIDANDGEFEDLVGEGGTSEDNEFDEIVGALEDLMIEDSFAQLESEYFDKHCHKFEATEENKLCYTEIFENYTEQVESYIEKRLRRVIPGFDLVRFALMCQSRKDEMTGEVFDLLLSLGDFKEFKERMLSHKSGFDGSSFFSSGSFIG